MEKLFHGKNKYLSLRAAHNLVQNQKKENEIIQIDAESFSAEKIIDTLYSPSLFAKPRVYFLKRIYKNKDKDILIENIFKVLDKNSISIIIWEDQKLRSNTRYFKFFKERKVVEEYDELNRRTFITWAREEGEKQAINMENVFLKELSERSNYDPERFVNNLLKLKLLNPKKYSIELLDQIVADTLESDIWKLMDSINNSDIPDINSILEKLLQHRVDPNYILAMIARNLRISIQTKYLLEKGCSSKKIASELKLPPFAIFPIIKAVKNTNLERILLQYRKLSNLDYEIKTGRIDPILGLSLFTLVL